MKLPDMTDDEARILLFWLNDLALAMEAEADRLRIKARIMREVSAMVSKHKEGIKK